MKQQAYIFTYLIPLAIYSFSLLSIHLPFQNSITSQEENCVYTYILEAENGQFTVSVLADKTITAPYNTTATAQVTLKVPTGNFKVANFKNLVKGVNFSENGRSNAPKEAPAYDYIVFGLSSFGTRDIPYTKGTKIPLFSFENSGDCIGKSITLMENFTDDFYPPNSEKANVSQQITVFETGSDLSIICIENNNISDCGETKKK